jgi:hypothetical protein
MVLSVPDCYNKHQKYINSLPYSLEIKENPIHYKLLLHYQPQCDVPSVTSSGIRVVKMHNKLDRQYSTHRNSNSHSVFFGYHLAS